MPGGWSYGGGRGGNSAGALALLGGEELVVVHNGEDSWAGAGRRLEVAATANDILRAGIL